MRDVSARLDNELRRLASGPSANEKPAGIGIVRFAVGCSGKAEEVLLRAKTVLRAMDDAALKGWPASEGLRPMLPSWFQKACAPPVSQEQAEQWLAYWKRLPADEQAKAEDERDWTLDNWLYWMEPRNRHWFWWDAQSFDGDDRASVAIETDAWPFPWGGLRWLLRAAGALAIQPEE